MDSAQELYNEGLNQGWNQITVRDSDDLPESIRETRCGLTPLCPKTDTTYQPATMPSMKVNITQSSSSTVIGTGWIGTTIDTWDIGLNQRRRSPREIVTPQGLSYVPRVLSVLIFCYIRLASRLCVPPDRLTAPTGHFRYLDT